LKSGGLFAGGCSGESSADLLLDADAGEAASAAVATTGAAAVAVAVAVADDTPLDTVRPETALP